LRYISCDSGIEYLDYSSIGIERTGIELISLGGSQLIIGYVLLAVGYMGIRCFQKY